MLSTVSQKRASLAGLIARPLGELARKVTQGWANPLFIVDTLQQGFSGLPCCHRIYAIDSSGMQLGSAISSNGVEQYNIGEEAAVWSMINGSRPMEGMSLSTAHLNPRSGKPSITVTQTVDKDDQRLGYLIADFHVEDMPLSATSMSRGNCWRQFKGDPAIRENMFMQRRVVSPIDEHLDEVIAISGALLSSHGIFHTQLHFSSSWVTMWHIDDPCNYQLYTLDELINPEMRLAYPVQHYNRRAKVTQEQIFAVLNLFKLLRQLDENIYLRSASINIVNALVGLTFSCDGSHYMPVDELLAKDLSFWYGKQGTPWGKAVGA